MRISNNHYLQERLAIRVNYLRNVPFSAFHYALRHFLSFIEEEPLLIEIKKQLLVEYPNSEQDFTSYMTDTGAVINSTPESSYVAFSYQAISKIAAEDAGSKSICGAIHTRVFQEDNDTTPIGMERRLATIRSLFLEPLYIYLNEQLNSQRVMLSLLKKYKSRSEWFNRDYLLNLDRADKSIEGSDEKESTLVLPLYEFLFDQGVEYSIEPKLLKGRIDIIGAQKDARSNRLMVEAKVFRGSNQKYICEGYGQLYRYLQNYNELFGFLVIYNISKFQLDIEGSEVWDGFISVTHNHKTIFFIVIDIEEKKNSISKEGKVNPKSIKQNDLFEEADGGQL